MRRKAELLDAAACWRDAAEACLAWSIGFCLFAALFIVFVVDSVLFLVVAILAMPGAAATTVARRICMAQAIEAEDEPDTARAE